jgi:GTP-binding protein HflX
LSDTVGFIRRLPHHLVESFKATLQEVRDADLMVHVVEASSEDPEHQIASVNTVLKEIVPEEKLTLMVFNKMDLVDDELFINRYSRSYPDALFVNGRSAEGADVLREKILSLMTGDELIRTVRLPISNLHCLSAFHRTGSVLEQEFEADMCLATLRLTEEELNRLVSREGAVLVEEPSTDT